MGADKDIDGKESAKRKYAKKLINNGIVMAWIAFVLSCFMCVYILLTEGTYQAIPTELIFAQVGAGLTALGFTLGERWGNKK